MIVSSWDLISPVSIPTKAANFFHVDKEISEKPGQVDGLASKRDITIEDFEKIRVVGRGGFSRVILARKKDTGRLYAIKILRKDQIFSENQIKPILSERRVLEQLDHPFVIKLHWAF